MFHRQCSRHKSRQPRDESCSVDLAANIEDGCRNNCLLENGAQFGMARKREANRGPQRRSRGSGAQQNKTNKIRRRKEIDSATMSTAAHSQVVASVGIWSHSLQASYAEATYRHSMLRVRHYSQRSNGVVGRNDCHHCALHRLLFIWKQTRRSRSHRLAMAGIAVDLLRK
jgi:hypothetical protein